MVYKARKQLMAWMETDYSKHTRFLRRRKMEDKMHYELWARRPFNSCGRFFLHVQLSVLRLIFSTCSFVFYIKLCVLY